ncbi:MAG: hypothetical protein VB051_03035 [Candidatus Pelethousia sp.]|nr:hypothetical protein [Candidatus Pelethousia sp.]
MNSAVTEGGLHYSCENHPIRLRFDLPMRLINEGDGRGFYSLDTNSQYFFGDILSLFSAIQSAMAITGA